VTIGIEIARPTVSAHGLTQVGAISLPGFCAPPGFASLFNGLLDQNASAVIKTSASQQGNATGNVPLSFRLQNQSTTGHGPAGEAANPATPLMNPALRKARSGAGLLKPATVHPNEIQTLLPVAVGEKTGSLPVSEPGGKDSASIGAARVSTSSPVTLLLPPQLGTSALLSASSPEISSPKPSFENAPRTGDIAFALQLSWQPAFVHPSGAPLSVSGAIAHQVPELSLSRIAMDASAGGARLTAAAHIGALSEAGIPQHALHLPATEAQPADAVAQSRRSADVPARKELESQACSQNLLPHLPNTRASSTSETDFLENTSFQSRSSSTTLEATAANTNSDIPAQSEQDNGFVQCFPNNTSPGTDDQAPQQHPPELGSSPDKSMASTSPVTFTGDKRSSGRSPLVPDSAQAINAPATPAAVSPSAEDSDSGTAADTGTKSGGKALVNPPPQKLSASPSNHEGPGAPADGFLLGHSADVAGAPVGRTKAVAPETRPADPAVKVKAAPPLPAPSIREVSIRLETATSSPVDVQLAAKAGTVQVAVRTPDVDLAKSLQTNLGELVGRLEEKGFKAEAWTPQSTVHTALAVRQPATSTANQGHSDQSGSPGGQPDARGGQRQSGHRQQTRWEAEFVETLAAPEATPPAGG
jgi:hypothetical protein